jgi:carbon-monoxide dehydrogenase medium subunit
VTLATLAMWRDYHQPQSVEETLALLARYQGETRADVRIIAGGTDLIIELDRGVRPICHLIDISRVHALDRIWLDSEDTIHLGPLVTHNQVIASPLCVERAYPLARACRQVGAPQIRNRATIAGNLITASPANDTITPLIALDATVTLQSQRGMRRVPLAEFYTGVRKTVMQPDEMMTDIFFRALESNQHGTFIKLGLRRAQAISVVNCCVISSFENDDRRQTTDDEAIVDRRACPELAEGSIVHDARITLGAVAPTIIRAREAEAALIGQPLNEDRIERAARLAQVAATPIDDVRGSAEYRSDMVAVIVRRALHRLMNGAERADWDDAPALLWTGERVSEGAVEQRSRPLLQVQVNGERFMITDPDAREKTLLRFLRENCGLIGTKEGCAEGECGACTVILDGKAVMACLVPAPRAHGASIVTIEGVNELERINEYGSEQMRERELHPLQQAFIDAGAVQCGYCTPGFIMSGAALLQEHPHPTDAQIKESISGNLCRCTGYYKILEAIRSAAGAQT